MPDNRDVTVVITCFNYGAYLPEAVASALGQHGGPPHVVVVDDGSDDPATITALDRLDPGVEVIRQANAGVSAARNTGIAATRTRYVVPLDADDRLPADALTAMRPPLDGDARLGFSYGRIRFFGDWGGILRLPDYDPYALLYRHMIGLTALIRRDMLDEIGGYDPAFRYYEDWELWVRALAHGWHGRRVDAVTIEYRRHGRSKHAADRGNYRSAFRQLQDRHADLYRRERELAGTSRLGPVRRAAYRHLWGPRPWPAGLETFAYRLLWRRPAG